MCGATGAQTQLQGEQSQFYQQLMSEYSTVFGESQDIMNQVNASMEPILKAGPDQQGFGANELTALNTQATEGTAQGYGQAAKDLAEREAGTTGTGVTSGGAEELQGQVATAAEAQRAAEENQITEANYAQGRQNWQFATQALQGEEGMLNPTGFAGETTGAGQAEGTTANQISQANDSLWNTAIGAIGGIGGQVVDQNPGNVFG